MSLNKHDFDAHRRAKRMRALKIDLIIIVVSLLLGIWMTIDHPAPAPNAPAFHKPSAPGKAVNQIDLKEALAKSFP